MAVVSRADREACMVVENIAWDAEARAMQQLFHSELGDRDFDSYKGNQNNYLLKNIGYALFGPADEVPHASNKNTGYTPKKLEEIEKMYSAIKENDDHRSMRVPQRDLNVLIPNLIDERKVCRHGQTIANANIRSYHVSEICNMVKTYSEDDEYMIMRLYVHIASAIYGTDISEYTLFNKSIDSNQKLAKIVPIFSEISSMMEKHHESNNTLVSVIFVVYKVEHEKQSHPVTEAVFRVPNESDGVDKNRFIDRNLRVYKGWEKYLENNKLPKGPCCYPVSGIYKSVQDEEDHVQVEFGVTPAGSVTKKALSVGDTVGSVIGVGAGMVAIATLVPAITVAAPFLLAATIGAAITGVYGVGRGVENLVDRSTHRQEMGLQNAEARNTYLSIAGSTLGIGAMGATTVTATLAREGQVLGAFSRFVVNALQISALTVNGVGVCTAAVSMHEKYKEGSLTTLDVFQFSSSVLFFTMSAVSFRTASTIIKETQQATINDYRSNNLRSNRHRKGFDRTARNTKRGLDSMEGNAKVIRSIRTINNPDEFFSSVVRINKHHPQRQASLRFADAAGQVVVNNAFTVEPLSFADLSKTDRIVILDATKSLANGSLTRAGFETIISQISAEYGMPFNTSKVIIESKMYEAFGISSLEEIDASVDGVFFSQLNKPNLAAIETLFTGARFSPDILKAAIRLSVRLWGNVCPEEFKIWFEFASEFIIGFIQDMEVAYQAALRGLRNQPNFNRDQFDSQYGFTGDRTKHFIECFEHLYSIALKIAEVRREYEAYRENRRRSNI